MPEIGQTISYYRVLEKIGSVPGLPFSWADKDRNTLILGFLKKGFENDYDIESLSMKSDGTLNPLWSPDGRVLFNRNGDAVMAVSVKTEPTFSVEKPRMLFQGKYIMLGRSMGDSNPWDISPDGKRFLMMKSSTISEKVAENPRKINIVLNWFEELKERVPIP